MTGSECGAPPTHSSSVSIALGRLRFGVVLCCWIVAVALLIQTAIWALSSFTELRWTQPETAAEPELVVESPQDAAPKVRSALADEPEEQVEPAAVARVQSKYDLIFALACSLAGGMGALAVLALAPLIGLGVILAASSATSGVDRTVSAFGWALLVGLLVMPIGAYVNLPWADGALWSYDGLTAVLDEHAASEQGALPIVFFARYLVLPVVCVIGIALVGMRFSAGVEAGLLMKENFRLDPALEQEAANVKPSSLHGGRAAAAMRHAVGEVPGNAASAPPGEHASVRQLSPGEAPKRLI